MVAYTKQTVFLGTVAGDKTGDGGRTAFGKLNDNFDVLFSAFSIDSITFDVTLSGAFAGPLLLQKASADLTFNQFDNTTGIALSARTLASHRISGASTTGVERVFYKLEVQSQDATNASEDANLIFSRISGGALTEYMRVDSSLGIRLAGGVAFSGDTAIAANLLDDYEEGVWTPVVIGTSTAGVGTYTVQNGRFTKIGNIVKVSAQITWTAHTGTGNIKFGGLPFTSAENTTGSIRNRFVSIPTGHFPQLALVSGTSEIIYEVFQVDGTDNVPGGKAIEAGGDIYVQITYQV